MLYNIQTDIQPSKQLLRLIRGILSFVNINLKRMLDINFLRAIIIIHTLSVAETLNSKNKHKPPKII